MTIGMNRKWHLVQRPTGLIKATDFAWREEPIPTPHAGEVLVRTLYLSLDPTNRNWASDVRSYLPAVELGAVMRGLAIGLVEQSGHADFQPGDIVQGMLGWQEYAVMDGASLTRLPGDTSLPITTYMGPLGLTGATAYFGLLDVGKPLAGETVVVSAAAGAVGSIVGQIGKIKGCRVVGIAGTAEKCRWLTEELGFDAAINYKTESVYEGLKQHCPDGIDVYFDNVGGEILEAVLDLVNIHARVVICGFISQYNAEEPAPGPRNFHNILIQRIRVEGVLILDYMHRLSEAFLDLGKWLAEGKLQYRVHVVDGLENAPQTLNLLFDGSNNGKLIIRVAPEA